MSSFSKYGGLSAPTKGEVVELSDGELNVPDNPIIPFIEGDGIGPDIWSAAQAVLEAAVEKAYGPSRSIVWFEVLAGEKANETLGNWLPDECGLLNKLNLHCLIS